ncbi:hypothetical protein THRCLA_09644 [Thraustotheca clavata]|uniref:Glycosyl transferase family 1 domain-containing protein n=1 Tax=Thraustotheca clavata TaxID=74557 RepID=A0A1V9YV41_9STRA|nr:hypothetical protein THRCLA_09644 [Thraustotheca clavata]
MHKRTLGIRSQHVAAGSMFVFFGCLLSLTLLVWFAPSPQQFFRQENAPELLIPVNPNDLYHDSIHLSRLNAVCVEAKDAIIPHSYNSSKFDKNSVWHQDLDSDALYQLLALCPQVDVFLPKGLRNHGYCEDAMAYVKFLHARALPYWVLELSWERNGIFWKGEKITYLDLCPETAILYLSNYWDGVDQLSHFPNEKTIILMPNIERYELLPEHFYRADIVLAKTLDAYNRIVSWYEQAGNPRNTKVIYTQHTTSNPTLETKSFSRNFENLSIFHANGNSNRKSTESILACWASRPDFPRIDIFSQDASSKFLFDELFPDKKLIPSNLNYHYGEVLSAKEFGKRLQEASVILCPSSQEGFGHYINQARASGALVATTDGAPMNEFISRESGVLVKSQYEEYWFQTPDQLMGKQFWFWQPNRRMQFYVSSSSICNAMDEIIAMSPTKRAELAHRSYLAYYSQMAFFKEAMRTLRQTLMSLKS